MNSKPFLDKYPSSIWNAFLLLLFATVVKTSIEVTVGLAGGIYIGIYSAITGGNFDTILLELTDILNLIAVIIADICMISILIRFTKKRRSIAPSLKTSLSIFPTAKIVVLSICALFAVSMIGGLVTQTLSGLLSAETPEHIESMMEVSGLFTFEFLLTVIGVVIVAPLFEEFLLRKLIMDGLLSSTHPRTAIFISALFFAIFHMNIVQGSYTLILGLYLAYLYYKTGSLKLVFIIHALNNLYAILVRQLSMSTLEIVGMTMLFVGVPALVIVLRVLKSSGVEWVDPTPPLTPDNNFDHSELIESHEENTL